MRRRTALAAASGAVLAAYTDDEKPAPVDAERLNRFAGSWNKYVAQLGRGVLDLKLWEQVAREWRGLR